MLTGMSGKRVRVLEWMVGKRGWVFTHLSFTLGVLTGSSQRRRDVDIDFFLMFSVVDENLSWYLDENIASFCTDPGSVDKEDEEFQESNKMHGQCQLHEAPVSAQTLQECQCSGILKCAFCGCVPGCGCGGSRETASSEITC